MILKGKKLKAGMKILFVASEAAPFIKVGGLGEVMNALPKALRALGHDARLLMPKYATIDTEKFPMNLELTGMKLASEAEDPHGIFVSNMLRHEDGAAVTYFLENLEYYEKRANVYGYGDDAVRWALLTKAALEFLRVSNWKPQVVVASDWQIGLLPNFLETVYKDDPTLSKIATIFSIHNLHYQGMFDPKFVSETEVDAGQSAIPSFNDPRLLKLNFMRRGIKYADVISTVSPNYAREITIPEYGEKLDDLLSERRTRLFGILNGIDYESYNPARDPNLEAKFGIKNLKDRIKNKLKLQKTFNLPEREDVMLFGIVSRLTTQKGFNLLQDISEALFENFEVQLILQGSGESGLMSYFQKLAERYPDKAAVHFTYDEFLPRLIFAGADAVLIPSKFEPSGLTQMEAMRYGAIPIVRKTGGLADTVQDYDPARECGTGFIFEKFEPLALYGTLVRAVESYKHKKSWKELQKRAMQQDFSWDRSAEEYVKLFKKAVRFSKP